MIFPLTSNFFSEYYLRVCLLLFHRDLNFLISRIDAPPPPPIANLDRVSLAATIPRLFLVAKMSARCPYSCQSSVCPNKANNGFGWIICAIINAVSNLATNTDYSAAIACSYCMSKTHQSKIQLVDNIIYKGKLSNMYRLPKQYLINILYFYLI